MVSEAITPGNTGRMSDPRPRETRAQRQPTRGLVLHKCLQQIVTCGHPGLAHALLYPTSRNSGSGSTSAPRGVKERGRVVQRAASGRSNHFHNTRGMEKVMK